MVTATAVMAAMVQPAGRVITTTLAAPDATGVAQVPVAPDVKVTVGVAGTVKLELNVTEMVLPAAREPVAEVVRPTFQVEVAWATAEPGTNVTPVGAADATS
jgi:hypothetical protein